MQVAVVKQNIRQVRIHKVKRNHAAVGKRSAFHLEVIKLGKIKNTIFEMNLKDQLVAHRKIHVQYLAVDKAHASKSHMVDSGTAKVAVDKSTIGKRHADKVAARKITTRKSTRLKFSQVKNIFRIDLIRIGLVVKIICHML